MPEVLRTMIKDRSGVTAIEYALIASFIGIVAVIAIGSIGTTLNGIFNSLSAGL